MCVASMSFDTSYVISTWTYKIFIFWRNKNTNFLYDTMCVMLFLFLRSIWLQYLSMVPYYVIILGAQNHWDYHNSGVKNQFFRFNISKLLIWFRTYLALARNIDPSIKTAPDSSMYQQEAISPRLKQINDILG